MSAVSFVAEILTVDGVKHRLAFPIVEVIDLGLLVVVLFDPDSNTRKFGQFPNLIAVRRDGLQFWVAELPSTSSGECYYRVREADGNLVAYSFRSMEAVIDPLTGHLISREFTK